MGASGKVRTNTRVGDGARARAKVERLTRNQGQGLVRREPWKPRARAGRCGEGWRLAAGLMLGSEAGVESVQPFYPNPNPLTPQRPNPCRWTAVPCSGAAPSSVWWTSTLWSSTTAPGGKPRTWASPTTSSRPSSSGSSRTMWRRYDGVESGLNGLVEVSGVLKGQCGAGNPKPTAASTLEWRSSFSHPQPTLCPLHPPLLRPRSWRCWVVSVAAATGGT